MNWTTILADAGIPEPPGHRETLAVIAEKPYVHPDVIERQKVEARKIERAAATKLRRQLRRLYGL